MSIDNLRIGYGDEQIIHIPRLRVRPGSLTALLGPVAAGKSTLLRQLAGDNELIPSCWSRGTARVDGMPVPDTRHRHERGPAVSLLPQKARLFLGTIRANLQLDGIPAVTNDQLAAFLDHLDVDARLAGVLDADVGHTSMAIHRATLMARLLLRRPSILFLDEPLSDVAMADEDWLLGIIRASTRFATVVFVSHNKNHARRIADDVILVSGGQLIEHTPAGAFFDQPSTELGRRYLESGSAWPSAPDTATDPVASPAQAIPQGGGIPSRHLGLRWILRGRLGGMHQPGLLDDFAGDLDAITTLGVNLLVTLTEAPLPELPGLARPLQVVHFPIVDMQAPEPGPCRALLEALGRDYDAGATIVFHCRGGLGRTGLMLACFLIAHRDMAGEQAIEHVRKVNPNYIQSEAQLQFVMDFARQSN